MINLHSCAETTALVNIECYQHIFSLSYFQSLFMIWKQKVFLQSPVKECTNPCYLRDFQNCCLTYLKLRFFCCCNKTILRILVDKCFNAVAFLCSFRNLSGRKKNTVLCICLHILTQIYTKIYGLHYC